ncbi:MAG: hypothetical protein K2Y22_05015 [Candidatus Obscuribacterales bacterium]|nr:hypothetical protein [Candidatus Obscuribacterales bacterium]
MAPTDAPHSTGRRQFLKSLFSLGGAFPVAQPARAAVVATKPSFFWADLKTGQVGFPTGMSMAPGLPGSLMKLVAACAISEDHLLSPETTFDCTGSVVVNSQTYHCQKPHGRLDLIHAIGMSCNVYFAQAAQSISPDLFLEHAKAFLLNEPACGIASGPFPQKAEGSPQSYVLGLNDSFKPHALQLLRMAALIGAEGDLPLLHSAESPPDKPGRTHLQLSNNTWKILKQGMIIARENGTAKNLDPENKLHIAAKTGTAPHGNTFQSWIIGYFPFDKPRYSFCLRASSGTSQDAAVPQAHKFLLASDWPT